MYRRTTTPATPAVKLPEIEGISSAKGGHPSYVRDLTYLSVASLSAEWGTVGSSWFA